jgi:hypothetical protein
VPEAFQKSQGKKDEAKDKRYTLIRMISRAIGSERKEEAQ